MLHPRPPRSGGRRTGALAWLATLLLVPGLLPLEAGAITVPLPGERNLEVHGFYELRLRVIGDDLPSNDLTLSQFRHVLQLDTELPVFPDGIGPFDFVLLYTRWQVSYECIYQRACGLFKSADAYGGSKRDVKRLPRNLREADAATPAVGGTILKRPLAAGTLRRTNEPLTPGHRPRTAINPAGVLTNPNPLSFIANFNNRSRLDGPNDQFALPRYKTRGGSYNAIFHSNYLTAARQSIGEPGFNLLLGKFQRSEFLSTTDGRRGVFTYLNSAISRARRDPTTTPAELQALVDQRNELLMPGGDPDSAVLDYYTIDLDLQREFLFPTIPGADALNLIATRPDTNTFEGIARQTTAALLTAPFGAGQGPRQGSIPYFTSLDFPIRPFGYFSNKPLDIVNNASNGTTRAPILNPDPSFPSVPAGAPPDLAFWNLVVPLFTGPDGRGNTADDLPRTRDQAPQGLTITSDIPESTWSAQRVRGFAGFTHVAFMDDASTPELETVDERTAYPGTAGKPLILFGVVNPEHLQESGCEVAGGTFDAAARTCTDRDGDQISRERLTSLGCARWTVSFTQGGVNAEGDCLQFNVKDGSPLDLARFPPAPGVDLDVLPGFSNPAFRPASALVEPIDLTDFKSKATFGDTLPARPPSPDGGSLNFRSPGLAALARKTHHMVSNLDQDFDEDELRWGHGASEDEHEFREGYVELEMMRGQLFARIGKLLMIWGKTELFRNVDVLNPVDLSDGVGVGRLEETRIGQWAAQFVASPAWAMRVGPLRDLRLEFAVVFDDFEPGDLGRCGESGSLSAGCIKGFGAYSHGLFGLGLVGEIRPDDQYNGLKQLDYGLKLDGHWGRFAFSISDFWGWQDTAQQEVVFQYERRVDPVTGAPVNAFGPLECRIRQVDGVAVGPDGKAATAGDNQVPSIGNCLLFDAPASPDAPQPLRATGDVAANHAVNQSLFHLLCTLTFDPDLGYCAFDQATDPSSFIGVSQVLSGQVGAVLGVVAEGADTIRLDTQPVTTPGFRLDLNRLVPVLFRPLPETLSLTLAPTQGALLGCGPSFVSVCGEFGRSAQRGHAATPEFLALRGVASEREAQGGVDLMNADATVFSQEFAILKALQPGALVGARGADQNLRYEAGIRIGGRDVPGSELGIDAVDLAPLSLEGRAELIRSRLEQTGGLAEGARYDTCGPEGSSGSVQNGCTDAWVEPMPWRVDEAALAEGRVLFQIARQIDRDPRCDPEFSLRDRDGDGVRERGPRTDGFNDLELSYCKNRVATWTPENAANVVVLNDPTDPTNPASAFIVEFDGDENDLFDEDGSRSEKLLEWVQRVESISEHCTNFIYEIDVTRTVAGSHLNRGCTHLEVISSNFERLFIALDQIGTDRAFDSPETVDEVLAMLDGDYSNDTFGDPIAGPDGIVAKNWRVFRDPATGLASTTNDVHVTQFRSTSDVVSVAEIAPLFDRDGDGVGDGATTLDLSQISLRDFFRGFNPDTACPTKGRCHLQTDTVSTLVDRQGAAPREFTIGTALPVAINAVLKSVNGTPASELSPMLQTPKINLLEIFETQPLAFARLWSGQEATLEDFTLRYDRGGFRHVEHGDIVLQISPGLVGSLSQSFDGDPRGTPDADVNVDGVYDGLDDGAPGPISDDNILCGSGIPGDVLQSSPQFDPFSEADAAAIAALSIPGRSPVHCGALNALLGATGQTLPFRRAGGDGTYGRRDFLWHGGQQLVLKYDKRNVLGFGVDFSEDRTNTSWNIELSWANDIRIPNADRFGGLSNTDEYALTISVDRPTFIRILNPSRTFFFNFQVFLRYLSDFHGGDDDLDGNFGTASGPLSGQASFTFFTGYFQDALQPRVTILWEPQSASAAVLWAIGYRFRPNLAANLGVNHFFGRPLKQRRGLFPAQLYGDSELHATAARGQSAVFNEDAAVFSLRYSW